MTDAQDWVEGNEQLYRSVRSTAGEQHCFRIEDGCTVFTVAAFLDKKKTPSVDRAKLHNFDPNLSRIDRNDGIVELLAANIRQIGFISQKDNKGKVQSEHAVDVIPDPIRRDDVRGIRENLAHAVITTQPPLTSGMGFERLKEALARLATDAGWRVEPGADLPGR